MCRPEMVYCGLCHTRPQIKFFFLTSWWHLKSLSPWNVQCWIFPLGQKLFLPLPGLWTLWSFPGLPDIHIVLWKKHGWPTILVVYIHVLQMTCGQQNDTFFLCLTLAISLGCQLASQRHLQMTWAVTYLSLISAEHEFPLRSKPKTSQTPWAVLLS